MSTNDANPLESLDDWENDLLRRYPRKPDQFTAPLAPERSSFRDYDAEARPCVREFYRLNHRYQTLEFVRQKHAQYLSVDKRRMGIWEAMEYLNQLVDDSDPDIDLPQIEHLLQTAEAIRADGRPEWFILAGLIHDLGKILCLWGEPQWAVVGDTFPVGCGYSPKVVYYDFFQLNPDWNDDRYSTRLGIYEPHVGMDHVTMSWGHDEYLYHVVKDHLPIEALYMIRYHSFYAAHRERDYEYLFDQRDQEMFEWVRRFNGYDLYSKSDDRPDVNALRPFYQELIDEYFPPMIRW